jgi:hypothetical protein
MSTVAPANTTVDKFEITFIDCPFHGFVFVAVSGNGRRRGVTALLTFPAAAQRLMLGDRKRKGT